jgi:Tol biopolymer transport system component/DNA-binding winged helix-turn-helix (wHTH) protein
LATYGSLRRVLARFDSFSVDVSRGQLTRSGSPVSIQDKPFQVLRLLLEAEGKVVTREQVQAALWPEDTFVDFEHGMNTAVKKLRQALGDSAERPRFVETLPKIGYRFLVPVEWIPSPGVENVSRRVVPIAPPGPTVLPPLVPGRRDPRVTAWRLVALAVAAVVVGVVALYLLRRPVRSEKLTIVPFTTFPGFEIAPSFSPDGNQIVFSWFGYEKEFQFDLYIKQVGQEHLFQLTHHPATFLASAWSPDGRQIAFMRQAEIAASGIYVISTLGGAERKLTTITPNDSWQPIAVNWSPDGKWLAFAKADPQKGEGPVPHFRIHLVNVETTEERALPDPSPDCANVWLPTFSADGKYLATVCALTEGVARIYVQAPDGEHPRAVADTVSSEGFSGLAWAADSRSVLYSSDHQLWRVSLGGRPEKLLFAQDVESVAVSRTGNRLAFAQVRHPTSIWSIALAAPEKAEGAASKLISSSRGDAYSQVSPDGKSIAFQSWRSGSPEIWVCERDGSNPLQLTSFSGPQVGPPSWSPDSRRIAFDLRSSGHPELYAVNVEGGPPKPVVTGTPNSSSPFWSKDGSSIYFSTEPPDAIWKVPPGGGVAIRITAEGTGRFSPQESTDATRVFFEKADATSTHVWSVPVNGGDEHRLDGMPADVAWVPERSGAYFISGAPRHSSLNHFDALTHQSHKVADLPGLFVIWAPSLSPDSRSFLFTGIEHSEGDLVLVEGFH